MDKKERAACPPPKKTFLGETTYGRLNAIGGYCTAIAAVRTCCVKARAHMRKCNLRTTPGVDTSRKQLTLADRKGNNTRLSLNH